MIFVCSCKIWKSIIKYTNVSVDLFIRDWWNQEKVLLDITVQHTRRQIEVRRCKKIDRVGGEYSTEAGTRL